MNQQAADILLVYDCEAHDKSHRSFSIPKNGVYSSSRKSYSNLEAGGDAYLGFG